MTSRSKVCRACQRTLPLDDFYRNPKNSDGRHHECKACRRDYQASYRQTEAGRAADRRQYARDRAAGKIAARSRLGNLIASGRLDRQPCEVCGDPASHAHHPDYDKPLGVQWLCPAHHGEVHRAGA